MNQVNLADDEILFQIQTVKVNQSESNENDYKEVKILVIKGVGKNATKIYNHPRKAVEDWLPTDEIFFKLSDFDIDISAADEYGYVKVPSFVFFGK
jgi:hypothetical protein